MKKILIILIALVLGSCDIINDLDHHGYIEPDLQQYVNSFVHEAAIRGRNIDVRGLKIVFKDLTGKGLNGEASRVVQKIYINNTSYTYKYEPEQLVYHEMGHLYLNLNHDDRKLPNGYSASIMAGKGMVFYQIQGHTHKRQYYVDQLFDKNTPIPGWAFN